MSSGRAWAYTGLGFGAACSVAANVGHAFLKPKDAPKDWSPQFGAIAWGVAIAVGLLISVEVLSRINWPSKWQWMLIRFGGGGVVGLVAATASYQHLSGLLDHWNEGDLIVHFGPAIVDGLMVLCSFALMAPESYATRSIESGSPEEAAPPIAAPPLPPPSSLDDEAAGRPVIGSAIDSLIEPIDRVESIGVDGRSDRAESTRSDARSSGAQSTRSQGRSRPRRSGGRSAPRDRSDRRKELDRAIDLGFVDRGNPTAESIRVALQCSPGLARDFREELKAAAAVGEGGPDA